MPDNNPPVRGWRRSSRCDTNTCLEIVRSGQLIWLRNSQRPDEAVSCTEPEWSAFRAGLLAGDFEDAAPTGTTHPRPAPPGPRQANQAGQVDQAAQGGRARDQAPGSPASRRVSRST